MPVTVLAPEIGHALTLVSEAEKALANAEEALGFAAALNGPLPARITDDLAVAETDLRVAHRRIQRAEDPAADPAARARAASRVVALAEAVIHQSDVISAAVEDFLEPSPEETPKQAITQNRKLDPALEYLRVVAASPMQASTQSWNPDLVAPTVALSHLRSVLRVPNVAVTSSTAAGSQVRGADTLAVVAADEGRVGSATLKRAFSPVEDETCTPIYYSARGFTAAAARYADEHDIALFAAVRTQEYEPSSRGAHRLLKEAATRPVVAERPAEPTPLATAPTAQTPTEGVGKAQWLDAWTLLGLVVMFGALFPILAVWGWSGVGIMVVAGVMLSAKKRKFWRVLGVLTLIAALVGPTSADGVGGAVPVDEPGALASADGGGGAVPVDEPGPPAEVAVHDQDRLIDLGLSDGSWPEHLDWWDARNAVQFGQVVPELIDRDYEIAVIGAPEFDGTGDALTVSSPVEVTRIRENTTWRNAERALADALRFVPGRTVTRTDRWGSSDTKVSCDQRSLKLGETTLCEVSYRAHVSDLRNFYWTLGLGTTPIAAWPGQTVSETSESAAEVPEVAPAAEQAQPCGHDSNGEFNIHLFSQMCSNN